MNASASAYHQICPGCGAILTQDAASCSSCGYSLRSSGGAANRGSAAPLITFERFAPLIKVLVVVIILAALAVGGVWAVKSFIREAAEEHPHPKDPYVTTSEFFTALQNQEYATCGRLLSSKYIAAKRVEGANHDPHLDRIHRYLVERAGNDFALDMDITPDGRAATFNNDIVLTIDISISRDYAKNPRYGIQAINDFPRDFDLGLGINARNRQVNRAIGNIDMLGQGDPDNLTAIIEERPGESDRDRLKRFIDTYPEVRYLDTRHELLEWIITEFPDQPQTYTFLSRLSKNEDVSPHLRNLARNALPDNY